MADFIVIYDPQKEVAAIVDADNRVGFGPAMIGPNAEDLLTAFVETIPYDITEVSSYTLRDWFERFVTSFPQPAETPAGSAGADTVAVGPDTGVAGAALAEHTAAASAGEPPAPAPADADLEANPGETDQVTPDPGTGGAPTSQAEGAGTGVANANAPTADGSPPSAPPEQPPYEGPCYVCNGTGLVPGAEEGQQVACNLCVGTGKLPAPQPA